jgi:hypothetical protein
MDPDAEDLPSYATHYWEKRVADEEMKCWGSGATIKEGDEYYEYIMELTLYGMNIDMSNPVVTQKEYFKHVLQGRPGFKYYDKDKKE